jgi:hypothetical protein
MLTVTEINDPAHLALFSQAWQTLWERTPHRTFFHTRQWLECYCRHYGDRRQLRTFVVFGDTQPVGIVPLVIKRTPTWVGPMRWLTYPLDGWGPSFGPVRADAPATMDAVFQHLANTDRDWDVFDLRGIDGKQLDKRHSINAFRRAALPAAQRLWEMNREIPVGTWSNGDWFLVQRRISEAEKPLSRYGRWDFVRARVTSSPFHLSATAKRLWHECKHLFERPQQSATWWSDVFAATLETQTADLCVLRNQGAPVAAMLNTVVDGRVLPLALGMAPGWGPEVETVCLGKMLLDSRKQGDATYLFGPRMRRFAESWPGTPRPSYRLTHFAPFAPRAQIMRFSTWRNSWRSRGVAAAHASS